MYITKVLQTAGYEMSSFGKVAHGNAKAEFGFDFARNDLAKRSDLTSAVKEYYNNRTDTTKPLCIMVGDDRPHVKWIANSTYNIDDVTLPAYFIDTKETREHWARYLTDITGLDNELGKLYQWTKETFDSNFIFIYTSDHGAQWPFGKWNLYDAGTKVPLMMVWPDSIQANTRTDAMVSWIDIFPTLFECVDAETPENLDGKSFKQVLKGDKAEHHEYIFTTTSGDGDKNVYPMRSIRSKKYKFIWNIHPNYCHTNHSDLLRKDGAGAYWDSWDAAALADTNAWKVVNKYYVRQEEEFFDLEADSLEQVNLIDSAEFQEKINTMRTLLMDWIDEQGDQLTVFNTPRIVGEYLYEFTDPDYVPDTADNAKLLFHFPFDGTLDESDNKYQLTGNNSATYSNGYQGQALDLDGTSDYFDLNTSDILNTGTTPFTICAWVYNTDTLTPSDTEEIVVHQLNGRILLENVLVEGNSTIGTFVGKSLSTAKGSPFLTKQWNHIAISSNPEIQQHIFYLNGKAIDSVVTTDAFESNINGFRIGAHKNGNKGFWHGMLDELYLFEGLLTLEQINSLMNFGELSSLQDVRNQAEFNIYPNPAEDFIHIVTTDLPQQISLFNLEGKLVLTKYKTKLLNTSDLNEGIYAVRVQFKNGSVKTKKVVLR